MSITIDVQVPSKFPVDKVFKVISDFDKLAPKVNPQVFKSVETVQGNGDVGTIKNLTFGDGKKLVSKIISIFFGYM
ncbi:hypothetical protein M8C21_020101 [Ambrosia artemisiifolia]|uniref:Bet v I/Major latex protein domain-containing protein n=1 Tax=Ambrosia artemisiifolia TaxID=4212 RepID=A0AAD5CK62_AMBAR|nr:hypothetical protein M8C21_020101 [Ambrosia artemisiifolia]